MRTSGPPPSAGGPKVLPDSLPPRGLSRVQAAAYIGVSPSHFDKLIRDRLMPPPKRLGGRVVWDRKQLDKAFDALDADSNGNQDDDATSDCNSWDATFNNHDARPAQIRK
jgi:predicted DNA-binding transcriptional regulator AlpA